MRAWRGRGRSGGSALLVLSLGLAAGGCAPRSHEDEGMKIRFEELAAPGAFQRTGTAVRDRPDGAGGLWAAVPGLPRPERAEVVNPDTGRTVTVALFRTGGETIRLSNDAAEALGIAGDPVTVRITALRSVPAIDY